MLGLSEIIGLFAMANSVYLYGCVLRREGGHVFTRTLKFDFEGKWWKRRQKRTWKMLVEVAYGLVL